MAAMDDFLAGKTNVSPLTGKTMKQRDADQLRAALTINPNEPIGAAFVKPPSLTTRRQQKRK